MAERPTGSTAADFAFARYGARTRPIETRVTVGTTVTQVLANNPRRISAIIENRSGDAGAIGLDREFTLATGKHIADDGGVELEIEHEGEGVAYARYAIGAIAGTWYVYEVVAY
jgi:hypothetical protein